ncbi:hypothetical protein BCR34DRAFT_571290 [Clohesyomyces aquaticus]|uniref:N-acetyltransferase domain-containing protein n=1 Tax=Clohesyomyces aquaticus TaxID=1231657 RepID=A0A1Y1Z9Q0_9PLEO|nr:hypothetical protein BCR34DRAFT_571290 [Clohesyomyces aquaticus]
MVGLGVYLLPERHENAVVWDRMISKQKDLRLQSLQLSPDSFSSTYDREAQFSRSEWKARLQNPKAFTFIAHKNLETPSMDVANATDMVQESWVGMAVLIGPLNSSSISEVLDDEFAKEGVLEFLQFEICGLFVLPDARRAGLGKALIRAAIAHAVHLACEKDVDEVCVGMAVTAGNMNVMGLYKSMGFVVAKGTATETEVQMVLRKTVH